MTALLLILLAPAQLTAKDLYVSPTGDDASDGSAQRPLRTIARARDVLRTAAAPEDSHIWLNDGVYEQRLPLVFDRRDSGPDGHHVIYQAVAGAHPMISGGRVVTGWTLHDPQKNIWQAPVEGIDTRQLYVNGHRSPRAHSAEHPLVTGTVTATGYSIPGTAPIANWKNLQEMEFVFNARLGGISGSGKWLEPRLGVQSVKVTDGNTIITMKQPGFSLANNDKSKQRWVGLPTTIENAYELLDQPGEWYLDKPAKLIFYIPQTGEDMANARVVAPVLQTLVQCSGTLEKPIERIEFHGIAFADATWLLPNTNLGFPELQANYLADYSTYAPGAVLVQHANHVRFKNCIFTRLGSAGLELSNGVQNSSVTACRFTDISGNGILQGTIRNSNRPDPRQRDDNNTIDNCYFADIGNEYHGACAIFNAYVSHTLISHNTIDGCPYSGISIGWGWGKTSYATGNRVLNNFVRNWGQSLSDCGAFYALSPQPNSEAAGNYFTAGPQDCTGGAFYPDEGSAGWDIHDNIIETNYQWIFIWTPSIKDLNVHHNWTNSVKLTNQGINTRFTDNQLFNGPPPPATKEITQHAGLTGSP